MGCLCAYSFLLFVRDFSCNFTFLVSPSLKSYGLFLKKKSYGFASAIKEEVPNSHTGAFWV